MDLPPHTKLDTERAARYVGCAKKTLEKYRIVGGGPAYLKPTRTVVYQVSDLDEWLNSRRHNSTSEYQGIAA